MPGNHQPFQRLVISAKLNRPAVRGKTIPRPHLIARLNAGLDKPLTLISAPAGFGKTTLAAQWLEQSSMRSAWLSLDPRDDDPEQFLRYMIAALDTAFPWICTESESLLSTATLPPPGYLADKMVSKLSELDGPILLVLDDYHNISSEAS